MVGFHTSCEKNSEDKNLYHDICTTIEVPSSMVKNLYENALEAKKKYTKTQGFEAGHVSIHYVKRNYHASLVEHVTEVLLIHYVYEKALYNLSLQKGCLVGHPVISHISLSPDQEQTFFSFTAEQSPFEGKICWKHLKIKFPARKKYKDLDRQAETFALQERKNKATLPLEAPIKKGDWVQFSLKVLNNSSTELLEGFEQILWLKMSNEEIDQESCDLFLGKKKGESFTTSSSFLNRYLAPSGSVLYTFQIRITQVVHSAFFCIENFQHYFHLKSTKDLHNKLIEVLSFRNDVSLRREIAQLILAALTKSYPTFLPRRLIDEQKRNILSRIVHNPDYLVYQAQKDFIDKIGLLAEKQVFEAIIIDYIAQQENITVTPEDIALFMNIMQRPRLRDFIYFDLPESKHYEQEQPVLNANIFLAARREKTLNYLISYLIKNN